MRKIGAQNRRLELAVTSHPRLNILRYNDLETISTPGTAVALYGTRGRVTEMFELKQLYVGGAVMAFAEVVTFVVLVATR
jgi:hypothetical protein